MRLTRSRWPTPALLAGLVGVSALIRTRAIDAGYWIDEGLSVGIADRPAGDIPGALRQDGSPPLYYLLLHGWMRLFGRGETATHLMSLIVALATIPLAYWVAKRSFGTRAGWACAVIAATVPFLTLYAQETRMYALVMLESLLVCGAFLEGPVRGNRWALPGLAASLALVLYTHNWGLHLFVGTVAASIALTAIGRLAVPRRSLVIALAATLAVFAPWIPTLADQARETGAPWSNLPGWHWIAIAATIVVAALVLARTCPWPAPAPAALVAIGFIGAVALVSAFAVARIEPGWATRYLSILAGPIVLLAAAAVARTRRLGTAGLAVVVGLWLWQGSPQSKSNVRELADALAPVALHAGDVVLSTQPEQVPVLAYYLPEGVRFMTAFGPVGDTGVMDWRDALSRLLAASPDAAAAAALRATAPGGRVLVVRPVVSGTWTTPWNREVATQSRTIGDALATTPGAVEVRSGADGVANIALVATVVPTG